MDAATRLRIRHWQVRGPSPSARLGMTTLGAPALHSPAAFVELVARDDRLDVLARSGEIDVLKERSRGYRLGVIATGPAQGAARARIVLGEGKWHRIRLVLPMLDRAAAIPGPRFEVCLRIEQFLDAKIVDLRLLRPFPRGFFTHLHEPAFARCAELLAVKPA